MSTPPPPPSPSNVGHGDKKERGKGAEEESPGMATKTLKAEAGKDGGALINIKVHSQTADDVFFHIKRGVKLRRLMDMYYGKHSLHPKAVLFLDPHGHYIRPNQTPDEVGLEDGDTIDIMLT
ncbi:small ubiquitin-related modifier 1-like [Miscanthus floridulus]|uniref:small ubiquitin-related modifier 1-like n=1 Tax=Miscanthus floridulus TaxID=154761 RepID=UPI00345A4130